MHKKIIPLLAFLFLTCCGHPASNRDNSDGHIRVTDFRGKEVVLKQPASRIVCLIESALSGLYMLDAYSQVAGISTGVYNESAFPQYARLDDRIMARTLPTAGNWDFINLESIVSLKPDLVIIWASQSESISAIEEKGIPVYAVFIKSFEDVYKEISDFGILTNRMGRADSIISFTKTEVRELSEKAKNDNKKSVYFVWSQGLLETSGTTSTVNELIELAGARNVCSLPQEHVVINKEMLLEYNPDIILMWQNNNQNPEDLLKLPELRTVKAVKSGDVYELPPVFWCDLWTLKYQAAVKILAGYCYPEKFADMDPEVGKRKMMLSLYGKRGQKLFE